MQQAGSELCVECKFTWGRQGTRAVILTLGQGNLLFNWRNCNPVCEQMVRRGKYTGYKRRLHSICSKPSQLSAGRWLKRKKVRKILCSAWLVKLDARDLVPKSSIWLGVLWLKFRSHLSVSYCLEGMMNSRVCLLFWPILYLSSWKLSLTLLFPVLGHCQESFSLRGPHIKTSNSREVTWTLSVHNKICNVPVHSKQQQTWGILNLNTEKYARKVQTWHWILLWTH